MRLRLHFAQEVKSRREQLDISQSDLAKRIDKAPGTVAAVEQSRQGFSNRTLGLLDRALLWEEGSAKRVRSGGTPTLLSELALASVKASPEMRVLLATVEPLTDERKRRVIRAAQALAASELDDQQSST